MLRLADKVGLVQNKDQRFADIIKSWPHIQIDFFAQLLYYAKMHYIHGWSDTWFYYRPINAHF